MTSQMMNLLARTDGLPAYMVKPERVWPPARQGSARQSMAPHHAPAPVMDTTQGARGGRTALTILDGCSTA